MSGSENRGVRNYLRSPDFERSMLIKMREYTLELALGRQELKQLAERFHYRPEDVTGLLFVYERMQPVMAHVYMEAVWEAEEDFKEITIPCAICAITLGREVDELQERCTQEENVLGSYMVECLAMELLNRAYPMVADRMRQEYGLWAGPMEFVGSGSSLLPMKAFLARLKQQEITCNEACMLSPLKSVVYWTALTQQKPCGERAGCEGCSSIGCKLRSGKADKPDSRRLHYGYQRIFGKGKSNDKTKI